MVFKIKNWDDSWDYVDKVDSVRFYPPGSFELFMKENSDGNFAPALRVVDTKSHIPHDIKDDFLRITTPELDEQKCPVMRCKYVSLFHKPVSGDHVSLPFINWAYTTPAFLMTDDGKTIERL